MHRRMLSVWAMVDWRRWRLAKLLLRQLYRRYAEDVGVGVEVGEAVKMGLAARLSAGKMLRAMTDRRRQRRWSTEAEDVGAGEMGEMG